MREVFVVVSDLFFLTRIQAVAARIGAPLESVSIAALPALCAERAPALVMIDLHGPGDVLGAVRSLKAEARTAKIQVVGFYSHVDNDTRARAIAAGVDQVLPRSAFTTRLPELLATGD